MDDNTAIRIGLVGVGGAGCNAVNRVYKNGITSAKTIALNTDGKHLNIIEAHHKVLLGRGLGAGGDPEAAKRLAEANQQKIIDAISGLDLIFISAGMGGGTGTGVAPIVAKLAKEQGAITVAMVTYPFNLERARLKVAQKGIQALVEHADTCVVVDNNKLLQYAPNLPLDRAFELVDNIVGRAVRGISDAVMIPSLLNIDFADVKAVMSQGGLAMIAVGKGTGNSKVEQTIESTIHHPLLDVSFEGAKGALVHLEGSQDLSLGDAIKIGEGITSAFSENAEVKMGARISPNLDNGSVLSTTIVTGVSSPSFLGISERKNIEKENEEILSVFDDEIGGDEEKQ